MGLDFTSKEQIFLWVLFVNLIVACVYLLVNILLIVPSKDAAHSKEEEMYHDGKLVYLMRFIIMLLCPVIGPLFFFCGYIFFRLIFRNSVDLEDVIFSKDRIDARLMADEDRERDIIPLEEAVLLNENKDLRSVMMNVMRGDISDSLASITLALNSEDSEVSHYAASVLSNELNNFRINVQKLWKQIQEEPEEPEYADMLIGYMDSILKQHIFTSGEQRKFVDILDRAAEQLYIRDPARLDLQRYEALCLRTLEAKDYENSEKWVDRLNEYDPNALPAYTCRLKLAFARHKKKEFFETLNRLKNSDVVIDNETLELIRVFG